MGKRRGVPEDLMGTILNESAADGTAREPGEPPDDVASWDEKPERVGVTFNLSKQLVAELEKVRAELRSEDGAKPSRSELVEVALRIAVEDAREAGESGELSRRLAERRGAQDAGTTRRSVDESGYIFETTYDESGAVLDEDVVGTVADLPVLDEYVDERGRLVSVARDELGNTFEQVMDETFKALETRLLPAREEDAR